MRQRRAISRGHPCQRAGIVRGAQHHHAVLDVAPAAIDHRETFDGAFAAGFRHKIGHLAATPVRLGLYAGVLRQRLPRHLPRQHQRVMFCHEAALAVEQAELGAAAQLAHHRAGCVRHVGVERRTVEGQAAGYRRLHVGAQPERSPRHFGNDGKAAVEFDRVECPAVAADHVEHGAKHGILRVAFVKLIADQIIARLLGRRAAVDVDQCDPRRCRRLARGRAMSSARLRPC